MTTHDYTKGRWGHAVTALTSQDGGARLRVEGFGRGVSVGDYLILANGPNTTRYVVEEIDYMQDPTDQWFAWIRFAPRPAGEVIESKADAVLRREVAALDEWPIVDAGAQWDAENKRRTELRASFRTGALYEHPIAFRHGVETALAAVERAESYDDALQCLRRLLEAGLE